MDFYDCRFASINCAAYSDLCVENNVQSYPMTVLYENGEAIETVKGGKPIETVGDPIKQALNKSKPDSRLTFTQYPKPGATSLSETKDEETKKTDDTTSEAPAVEKAAPAEPAPKDDKPEQVKPKDSGDSWYKARGDRYQASLVDGFKSLTSAEQYMGKKVEASTAKPNPSGVSVSLTAEGFQKLVTLTQDPWFIKFYAPWCPHCQALGPTWDQLGKSMHGKMNIGEVNCDIESRLCRDVGVKSFPTLLFFKGGEHAEYQGLRGLGDFVKYSESALGLSQGVPDVTAEELAAMEENGDEVIFVYFYDHATTSEDFRALDKLPLSLIGHAKLVKTRDQKLNKRFTIFTWPRLIVLREGRPTYYEPLTPNSIRDKEGVLNWMRSVWLPLVPELTAANAKQIMDRRIVAMAIVNPADKVAFDSAIKEMKSAANEFMDRQIQEFQLERKRLRDAKQMRIEEAQDRNDERAERDAKGIRIDMNAAKKKDVGFAWVDGVFWEQWIRKTYNIQVADGERVIINDEHVSGLQLLGRANNARVC